MGTPDSKFENSRYFCESLGRINKILASAREKLPTIRWDGGGEVRNGRWGDSGDTTKVMRRLSSLCQEYQPTIKLVV